MLTATAGAAVAVLILLLILFIVFGSHLWALIDSIIRPDWAYQRAGTSKVMWILLNVFLGVFAAIPYLLSARPKLQRAQSQGPGPSQWPQQTPPPGWYPDPGGRYESRYWNGVMWTDQVATRGVTGSDPIGPH